MPSSVIEIVENFIAEHHVEQAFFKRVRDRPTAAPGARAGGSEKTDEQLRRLPGSLVAVEGRIGTRVAGCRRAICPCVRSGKPAAHLNPSLPTAMSGNFCKRKCPRN